MRKIFLTFLIYFVMAANVASAEVMRVSDDDAQTFIHTLAEIVYDEEFQAELPLLLTNAEKFENTEMPEIGKTAWGCQFGLKTATKPEGEIVIFTDNEEKVYAIKVLGYYETSIQNTMTMLVMALRVAGLNQGDTEFLITNLKEDDFLSSSIVWSAEKNRCFVLIAGAQEQFPEGFQFVVVASDKKD